MKVLYVKYLDHYSVWISPSEKPPVCVNDAIGSVVEETGDSITLRHGRADIGGISENWEVVTIQKAEIVEFHIIGEIEV